MGSQRTPEEVVGVSIEEEDRPRARSGEAGQPSSQPAEASPSPAMACQTPAPVLLPLLLLLLMLVAAAAAVVVVVRPTGSELGQPPERKQCSLRSLRRRIHCWSQSLFWVRPLCWKFQTEELFAAAADVVADADVVVVVVVGEEFSPKGVFGIFPGLHLFLSQLC